MNGLGRAGLWLLRGLGRSARPVNTWWPATGGRGSTAVLDRAGNSETDGITGYDAHRAESNMSAGDGDVGAGADQTVQGLTDEQDRMGKVT